MYMQDGKQVIPYGRKTHSVNNVEFSELLNRVMRLEQQVAELSKIATEKRGKENDSDQ